MDEDVNNQILNMPISQRGFLALISATEYFHAFISYGRDDDVTPFAKEIFDHFRSKKVFGWMDCYGNEGSGIEPYVLFLLSSHRLLTALQRNRLEDCDC